MKPKRRGFEGHKGERTTFAFCPTCHTLHVGVMGKNIVCEHDWGVPKGGMSPRFTRRILKYRIAQRVRDSGWRW